MATTRSYRMIRRDDPIARPDRHTLGKALCAVQSHWKGQNLMNAEIFTSLLHFSDGLLPVGSYAHSFGLGVVTPPPERSALPATYNRFCSHT